MATVFFPAAFNRQVVIDVPNPGCGEILVQADFPGPLGTPLDVQLYGTQIGEALRGLIELATLDGPPALGKTVPHLGEWTISGARGLLDTFVAATVLAAAGTDRADRILGDADHGDLGPLCARCGDGSAFDGSAAGALRWCGEHGHMLFGRPG